MSFLKRIAAGSVFVFLPASVWAGSYTFQTIDNNGDPAFNQLLGINSSGEIAGYFGDGTAVPNNGYTVVPPYKQVNFTAENFPGAFQTQVTGINSNTPATTVGFWADPAGDNFGWYNKGAGTFVQVVDPSTPTTGIMTNQLLGVNNSKEAVGFYVDASGNAHGYMYNINTGTFVAVTPTGATSTTAAAIANNGVIAGFFSDATGTHGFIDISGTIKAYNDPGAGSTGATMFFGVNSNGDAVGSYVDATDVSHGFLFDYLTNTWTPIDDPLESATAAFGIQNTVVNGINDANDLVGFYSDGTNVNGFLATPVPEPASLGLIGLGAIALGGAFRARRRKA